MHRLRSFKQLQLMNIDMFTLMNIICCRQKHVKLIGTVCTFVVFGVLLYSVVLSGMRYQYDYDELSQLQTLYLIFTGNIPYKDFYYIYVPFLHILVLPIFYLWGANFETASILRLIMIVLFLTRIFIVGLAIKKILNWKIGRLYAFLNLFDAMTIFAGMQIRVDNLMLFFYSIALYFAARWVNELRCKWLYWASLFWGLSSLANIKLFPSFIIIYIAIAVYLLMRKSYRIWILSLFISALPWIVSMLIMAACGALPDMIQQVFLDPQKFLSSVDYPTLYGAMYRPDNDLMWGASGAPMLWHYTQFLLWGGIAGGMIVIIAFVRNTIFTKYRWPFLVLALSALGQWYVLTTIKTAFIQYYLPLHIYAALFSALFCGFLFSLRVKIFQRFFSVGIAIFVVFLTYVSFNANVYRSYATSDEIFRRTQLVWDVIPEGSKTFPDVLFRPIAYPLTVGYFVGVQTSELQSRYQPMEWYLEKYQVPYLVLDEFRMVYLSPQTKEYIQRHYALVSGELWIYKRTL